MFDAYLLSLSMGIHVVIDSSCGATVEAYVICFAGNWMDTDDNADVVNVLVTTGQLVPTLGKLLLFKLDGAFKATCKQTCSCCHC